VVDEEKGREGKAAVDEVLNCQVVDEDLVVDEED
jgi:hypothetical protein